jgi:hypothetical protein
MSCDISKTKPEVQSKAKEAASVISPLNMISILLLGCVMGQPDDVMPDARLHCMRKRNQSQPGASRKDCFIAGRGCDGNHLRTANVLAEMGLSKGNVENASKKGPFHLHQER